jgi:lysozyme
VALAFNIGLGAFATSTVLKKHKKGDYPGAGDAFLLWNKSRGSVLPGLVKRRAAERELYLA